MASEQTMQQADDQGRKADAIDAEISKVNSNAQVQIDTFQQKADAYRKVDDMDNAKLADDEVAKIQQRTQQQIDGLQQQSHTFRNEQQRLMKQAQDEREQEKRQAEKERDEAEKELRKEKLNGLFS